jgi:glutaredoxin
MTQQAVKELKLTDSVEYLTGNDGIQKIIELGSMSSPVLAIDDKIAMVGFTPDIEKIKELLTKGNNTSRVKDSSCSCGGKC